MHRLMQRPEFLTSFEKKKTRGNNFQLMENNTTRLCMGVLLLPCLLGHFVEPRESNRKLLQLERSLVLRAQVVHQKKSVMVGERRGKRAKNMFPEADVPIMEVDLPKKLSNLQSMEVSLSLDQLNLRFWR